MRSRMIVGKIKSNANVITIEDERSGDILRLKECSFFKADNFIDKRVKLDGFLTKDKKGFCLLPSNVREVSQKNYKL